MRKHQQAAHHQHDTKSHGTGLCNYITHSPEMKGDTMKKQVFNLETTKLELHFSREEYAELTEEQKQKLKSNFLWSRFGSCWVSRAKEPNLYWSRKVAKELGFEDEQREGERISFAEQIERKQERAEARADRYDGYAENAEARAKRLQTPINDMHGDIAFFTQPNINSSAGRSFRNRREKMFAQFDRGFAEYSKSEHFKDRASTARKTAKANELNDLGFLNRRVKEHEKNVRDIEKRIVELENNLFKVENGEELKKFSGELVTAEELQTSLEDRLELLEVYMDKVMFYKSCIDDLGGYKFSKDNIKVGYIVKISGWRACEVISTGTENITFKTDRGFVLKAAYAEITEIIKAAEAPKEAHPYIVGEEIKVEAWNGSRYVERVYKVVKASEVSVTLQCDDEKLVRRPRKVAWREGEWALSVNDSYRGTVYKKAN